MLNLIKFIRCQTKRMECDRQVRADSWINFHCYAEFDINCNYFLNLGPIIFEQNRKWGNNTHISAPKMVTLKFN